MTTTRVYIVFYSGRPLNYQRIAELSGVEPTRIEVKGEPKISRITGDIVDDSGNLVSVVNGGSGTLIRNATIITDIPVAAGTFH